MKSKVSPDSEHRQENESFEQGQRLAQELEHWSDADDKAMEREVLAEAKADDDATRKTLVDQARLTLEAVFPESKNAAETQTTTLAMGTATAAEKLNEDRYYYDEAGTAIICDGVGSSGNGAEAAQKAVDFLTKELGQLDWVNDRGLAEKIMTEVLLSADAMLRQEQKVSGDEMASTASVVKVIQESGKSYAVIGNMGDSPVYLLRDGKLTELTDYHENLPARDKRQALGKSMKPAPNVFSKRLKPGDRVVVSSNGLRKNDLKMKRMQSILKHAADPNLAATRLAAELNGFSQDARTVVVIDAGS